MRKVQQQMGKAEEAVQVRVCKHGGYSIACMQGGRYYVCVGVVLAGQFVGKVRERVQHWQSSLNGTRPPKTGAGADSGAADPPFPLVNTNATDVIPLPPPL